MTDDAQKTPVSMPITGNKAGRDINVTGNTFNIYPDPNALRTASGVLWNLPFIRNDNFTGEAAIETLRQKMVQHGSVAVTHQRQVVHGLGGIGKTQLALEYCYRCDDETQGYPTYKHAWWIDAETDTSTTAGLAGLAVALGYEAEDAQELVQMAQAWLSQHDDWLLVFDNVENPKSVEAFLPKSKHGHVLITSRASNWHGVVNDELQMQVWDEEEALAFLCKRLGRDDAGYAELAEELGYLPLSLAHAAAYIGNNNLSVAEYLSLYREYRADLNLEDNQLHGYKRSVATAVLLSVNCLQKQDKIPAWVLIHLCAFLAANGIPKTLFINRVQVLPEILQQAMDSPIHANRCWRDLLNLSLLDEQTSGIVTMHRVVQEVIQDSLHAQSKQATLECCLYLLADAFVFHRLKIETWEVSSELAENVSVVISNHENSKIISHENLILHDRLGNYYQFVLGDYASAEPLLATAVNISEALYSKQSITYIERINNFALLLTNLGKHEKALNYFTEVIKSIESKEPDPNNISFLHNLAYTLESAGLYKEAEEFYRMVIDFEKNFFGEEHVDHAMHLSNLANLLRTVGEYEEAEILYRKAVEIDEATVGENHPEYATHLHNLASILEKKGEYKEAENHLRKVLDIDKKNLGENHPNREIAISSLAELLRKTKQYEESEKLLRESIRIIIETRGKEHPSYAISLYKLAGLLVEIERAAEAIPMFEQAHAIFLRALGESHAHTQIVAKKLASIQSQD